MRIEDITEVFITRRVVAKIWIKHQVSEEEVYEVFENPDLAPTIRRSSLVPGSHVVLGRTLAGRYLVVALFPKADGRVDVATARDMTDNERVLYARS